jgi:hypothetical protein
LNNNPSQFSEEWKNHGRIDSIKKIGEPMKEQTNKTVKLMNSKNELSIENHYKRRNDKWMNKYVN